MNPIIQEWGNYSPHINGLGGWWDDLFASIPQPSYRPSNDLVVTTQYGEDGMGPTWSEAGKFLYMGRPQRANPPFPDTGVRGLGVYAVEKDFEAARLRADLDALMSDSKLTNMAMIGLQAIAAFAAMGIFIVQVRALSKRTRKSKKRSR